MADNNKIEQIIQFLGDMKVKELQELVTKIQDSFGIKMENVANVSSNNEDVVVEKNEQTEFKIIMTSAGQSRTAVIQHLVKNFGFKIGELISACQSENVNLLIKENVNKEQAEEIKKQIENLGAQVKIE
ncbi:MAG: ribosomal protein L7/L12 [Pigeon pea little leaf phytoplasma]|uniref:50S ribosomal protein L7/L12 n=1 Tax=Candidatus Phytoplasma fabacearum TaxID=2982628 RepID=A0ABU8ZS69_9MOLU|nr:ribosomal protein L7/L12 ['Bituminaria bituminosa' little leaf phytoplasma]MDV3148637.1 ribosomal protein L7/L12 [Pigeon pea little leaf phytoplasma]MDO7983512.1 ribosomal protein L7/L12 ['Bituminaria bituminosa' little leaf phytoplasma]MDO8023804.1 ribosomal protein L7/L12 ['Bituminaria bituminosa' little leaf phytoplasma]MDO8030632.1 ribosomal protein L7/L12 ['Bituminaria bituminosa' little leaf phytoplasma]MDV3154101.1 ribosomal protein L7/L12 [Pigeon pea little leaf phytoplasma]